MKRITVTIYNLNFTIKVNDASVENLMDYLATKLVTYSFSWNKITKRMIRNIDKSYFVYDRINKVYRFPISLLRNILSTLIAKDLNKEDIEIVYDKEINNLPKVEYGWNKDFILRDYQEDYVDAFIKNKDRLNIALIDMPTGLGKSTCAAYIIKYLQLRVGIFILPKYINKWVDDVKKYLLLKNDEICVVQGSESLISLMLQDRIEYKAIIFSITSITNYLSDIEENIESYPIVPNELLQRLGIGIIFNDETHQHFHAITRVITYMDAKYFLGSTATLISKQPDIDKLYRLIIPENNRISNLVQSEPYVNTKAVYYHVEFNKRIKYKRAHGYSHNLYEQSICHIATLRKAYFEMLSFYIQKEFIMKRTDVQNDKMVIFFASIDMCELFTKYIKSIYPKENIYKYVGGDDYNTMLKSNIIISNPAMLGTAIDIPNLITVLQTVSSSSIQLNLQNFGRLRKLKNKEVYYIYFFTRDIPRQYMMHQHRYEAIKPKSKEFSYEEYKPLLRSF